MRLQLTTRRPGTTLVEILVVMTIIATLSTLSFVAFTVAKNFGDKINNETASAIAKVNHNIANHPGAQPVAQPNAGGPPRPLPQIVPGEYYVGFNPGVRNAVGEAHRLAALVGGSVDAVYTRVLYGFYMKCADAKIAQVALDPAVKFVEPSRYAYPCQVPKNIKRVRSNGIMGNKARWDLTAGPPAGEVYGVPPSIYRFATGAAARPVLPVTSRPFFFVGSPGGGTVVAIMDTGIDNTHPDLFVIAAQDFTGGNNPIDTHGHGTHVAGVVGAADKSAAGGVVGVYPGAPLINVKIMNTIAAAPPNEDLGAAGTTGTVLAGLNYVLTNAATIRVCLMSFTMTAALPLTVDAMVNAAGNSGVHMVAAAGNNGAGPQFSPATAAQAIRVGALSDSNGKPGGQGYGGAVNDDFLAGYSNRVNLDFAAPGGDTTAGFYTITSTVPMANVGLPNFVATPYSNIIRGGPAPPLVANAQGTSFAAAHVAGMIALVLDPQSDIGFIFGGHGISTFRLQMTDRNSTVQSLLNLTRRPEIIQTINPKTGSMWSQIPLAGTPLIRVVPFTINLGADVVVGGPGAGTPIANFYANPGPDSFANLPTFTGNSK